jgi:hypothetical protein
MAVTWCSNDEGGDARFAGLGEMSLRGTGKIRS